MPQFFATTPKGLPELLREELMSFGATSVKMQPTGVTFNGSLEVGYRSCLWTRLANHIYYIILDIELDSQDDLTQQVANIDWIKHLNTNSTFSVSFSGQGLDITHSHYGALKVKDGIVDYFQEKFATRPNIDTLNPDLKIHAHLNRNKLTLSIDLTGYSLHQRGYREGQQGIAPLKENVAAAILLRANWAKIAKDGGTFYDPMCGSATFLIEATMIASDLAPGLAKANNMALNFWLGHDDDIWQELIIEAQLREQKGLKNIPKIYGSDISHKSLDIAIEAIASAGYSDIIEIKQMSIEQGRKWGDWQSGLIVTNPPYGERLGEEDTVKQVYMLLGDFFKLEFEGWKAAVLTCHQELGMYLGLKAKRSHTFHNGAMECKLFRLDIEQELYRQPAMQIAANLPVQLQQLQPELAQSDNAKMVANRIKKNIKNLKSWVKNNQITAYRVYDADIPEYCLAIDIYETQEAGRWVVVAEYKPPKTINPTKAKRRLYEAISILPSVFGVDANKIIFKVREKQKGTDQYEKLDEQKNYFTIVENNSKARVNFTDYLDTGLFLDSREIRQTLASLSTGKTLLNLFCYTATATTQAVAMGCKSSLSLDMSNTYLYWAKHNFMNNNIDEFKHKLQQQDVIKWLDQQATLADKEKAKFDVIFLDPPSFSTSKRMDKTLDIQRDHADLIFKSLSLLTTNGKLVFCTNLRKFKLNTELFKAKYNIENITQKTMPKDFKRNSKIHQVWIFSKLKVL